MNTSYFLPAQGAKELDTIKPLFEPLPLTEYSNTVVFFSPNVVDPMAARLERALRELRDPASTQKKS